MLMVGVSERTGRTPAHVQEGPWGTLLACLGPFQIPRRQRAAAMRDIAEADVESVPTDSLEATMQYVVLGTLLMEPVLHSGRLPFCCPQA